MSSENHTQDQSPHQESTSPVQWLSSYEDSVWRTWLELNRKLNSSMDKQLQQDGNISFPEYEVLVNLSEHPEHKMRISALAQALDWDRSRLSHLLNRMNKRGFLTKESCNTDARGSFAVLSSEGFSAIKTAAPGHVNVVRTKFLDNLRQSDRDSILALGEKYLP